MLVTSRCDSDHSWPFNKYDPSRKPASPPRMSNPYGAAGLSAQSQWQGQHQYPSGDANVFPHSLDSSSSGQEAAQLRPAVETDRDALGIHIKEDLRLAQVHKLPGVDALQDTHASPVSTHSETMDGGLGSKIAGSVQGNPHGVFETQGHGTLSSPNLPGHGDNAPSAKSDEDDDFDEDDILDGEGDLSSQTAAERTAARRKMKRFRLTHQQTRFLMSEFAKQPHPDAAHRERLSREIPGLSPRQVQVWFQNRRAKIKRLNADDRDRMIKMRAVPDDFDNVQALHSPYGAVHGLGTPMPSPGDLGTQSYAQHMIRPLVVDVRRGAPSDHSSPTGLTPGFGGLGFNPAAGMSNTDLMSPISPAPNDRYPYGSHFSAPMNGGARTLNPYGGHGGLESSIDSTRQSPPHPLQPSQLRDSISRSRSESAQSPLRSSMAWKGDAIDYANYRGANTSPSMSDRNQSMYQPGHMGSYDSASFPNNSTQQPTSMSYSTMPSPLSRSRLRAATATLPLSVDPRDHYRNTGSDVHTQSPLSQPRSTPTSTTYSTSSYATSYPSAPLATPAEYSVPRSSDSKANMQEAQMSAPMAPPSDFSQALHGNMGNPDQARHDAHRHMMSGREGHKRKRSLTLPTGSTRPLF